jgi:hypothetical protein
MKSPLSLVALILIGTATAHGQYDHSVTPLNALGVSFGATATEVVRACERAGLTITKLDTNLPHGRFRLYASGWSYRGHAATIFLAGGGIGPFDKPTRGLCTVAATIESDGSEDARRVYSSLVDALTVKYGAARTHEKLSPADQLRLGFETLHHWTLKSEPSMYVEVMGCVDEPVSGAYLVRVYYCQVLS